MKKWTRKDIQIRLKDHLQLGVYVDIKESILNDWINEVLTECFPKFYGILRLETLVESLTDPNYELKLPEELMTVTEVLLKYPGYYNSSAMILDTDNPFRFTDTWIEDRPNSKYLRFRTDVWKGTLLVAGECVLHFPLEDEQSAIALKMPSIDPIIHKLAARYFNRKKNLSVRNGDRLQVGMYERAFAQENQLGELALLKVKMPRLTNRMYWSVRDKAREAENVYEKSLCLPIQ